MDMFGKHLRPAHAGMLLAALLTFGCATKEQGPVAQMATTRAAVNQAESVNARTYAPLELRAAQEKLAQAETAMQAENHTQARQLAERAEADAKLAEAKAQSQKSMAAVDQLNESIQTLREELDRRSQ